MEELEEKYKDDEKKLNEELGKIYQQYRSAARAEMPNVPVSMLVDHIEHIVKVAGIDHVGLGSDFDGIGAAPDEINDCTDLFWIVVELRKRGWNETDIRKFLGENTLRVIKENLEH